MNKRSVNVAGELVTQGTPRGVKAEQPGQLNAPVD
jgi:hypothetical protein